MYDCFCDGCNIQGRGECKFFNTIQGCHAVGCGFQHTLIPGESSMLAILLFSCLFCLFSDRFLFLMSRHFLLPVFQHARRLSSGQFVRVHSLAIGWSALPADLCHAARARPRPVGQGHASSAASVRAQQHGARATTATEHQQWPSEWQWRAIEPPRVGQFAWWLSHEQSEARRREWLQQWPTAD